MGAHDRPTGYPEHWEADVVLRDGSTCHLRPITPEDGPALREFYSRLSDETIYFRFFGAYPQLSNRDVHRFTNVDYHDRVALIATIGDELIGVVRYDKTEPTAAEVAFVIRDDFQSRGLGTVFLEHIAQAAREQGVQRFTASVLPENIRMLEVFEHAGYRASSEVDDGVANLSFDIRPTASAVAVSRARELRAEALSVRRLLIPASVAVVGASRDPEAVGRALLDHVVAGDFPGRIFAINPSAQEIGGVRSYRLLSEIEGGVDLALVAVPAEAVEGVIADAAKSGVHGLVVVSAGFSDAGEEGARRQDSLVRLARARGMRIVGPNALGLINTDPAIRLNASVSPIVPPRGRLGFFSQSGALGISLLDAIAQRGLGLSTFVSAGNRADISGNDLLQYWEEDEQTDVVMLYLESIGNPRKFSRIARRLGRSKPIVAVRGGERTQGVPLGNASGAQSLLSEAAVEQMFRQAGVIRTETVSVMFDVAQMLATSPLPAGRRVSTVGNSHAVALLAEGALTQNGLQLVGPSRVFPPNVTPEVVDDALQEALADPSTDSVVAIYVPGLHDASLAMARVFARAAGSNVKPLLAVMFAAEGFPHLMSRLGARDHSETSVGHQDRARLVPTYSAVEDAARALGAVARYADWQREQGAPPLEPEGVDLDRAQALTTEWLLESDGGCQLDDEQCRQLLACYGLVVWPRKTCYTADQAVHAAEQWGYPVVLKTVDAHLRLRSDLGGIYFDIATEAELRRQFAQNLKELKELGYDRLVVQKQADPGVAVVVETCEDPLFGPALSFGIAGIAYDVMDDRSHAIPPLTHIEVDRLISEPKAAQLLAVHETGEPLDLGQLRDIVARVAQLSEDLPEVAALELRPIVVARSQTSLLGASIALASPVGRVDQPARRLLG